MAQTILGLDIGAYSVKIATLQASFRSLSLISLEEFVVPHAGRVRPERAAAEVLESLSQRVKEKDAVVVAALPGDRVMTRFVSLPFDDPKRIESVLGFELEGVIPLTVGDMVYAYQPNGKVESGEHEVFAAATQPDTIENYLETLGEVGIDPRVLTLDTTSYVNLYDHVANDGETVAFIDVGHRTTKICVVDDGKIRLARSLGRGGMAVTESIADVMQVEFQEAERIKHESGALPFGGQPPTPVGSAAQTALKPLVVGLRQSLHAYSRQYDTPVTRVFLTGGGARLQNLSPWLEKRLGVAVVDLDLNGLSFNKADSVLASGAKSVGLALLQAGASKNLATLNFRRGQFGYEGDFQFVRERLRSLAAMAAVLLIVASAYAVVKSNTLDRQLESQKQQLADFTKDKLGKKQTSFSKTLKMLKRGPSTESQAELFPPMTAIVVLDKITQAQEDQNRGMRAGGPSPTSAPNPRGARAQAPARRHPMRTRPGAVRGPKIDPATLPKRPVGRPPFSGTRPPTPPTAKPGADAPAPPGAPKPANAGDKGTGDDSGKGGDKTKEGGDALDASQDAKKAAEMAAQMRKIELSMVNIDVFNSVKVTAETHESNVSGKEEFRKRLESERCFTNVKRRDLGEVISTGRHSDWVRFEVTFNIRCPKKDAPQPAAEKGKKGTKKGGEDDQ